MGVGHRIACPSRPMQAGCQRHGATLEIDNQARGGKNGKRPLQAERSFPRSRVKRVKHIKNNVVVICYVHHFREQRVLRSSLHECFVDPEIGTLGGWQSNCISFGGTVRNSVTDLEETWNRKTGPVD